MILLIIVMLYREGYLKVLFRGGEIAVVLLTREWDEAYVDRNDIFMFGFEDVLG